MKRKLLALLAAMTLTFALLSACSGGNSAGGSEEKKEEAMSKDDYLKKAEALVSGDASAEALSKWSSDKMFTLMANSDSKAVDEYAKELKERAKPFVEFAAIKNSPKGYEDAHKEFAKAVGDFGKAYEDMGDMVKAYFSGNMSADQMKKSSETNEAAEKGLSEIPKAFEKIKAVK